MRRDGLQHPRFLRVRADRLHDATRRKGEVTGVFSFFELWLPVQRYGHPFRFDSNLVLGSPVGRLGSIVEIKRIQGPIFNNKEAAEEHGLKLCKDWIDKRP